MHLDIDISAKKLHNSINTLNNVAIEDSATKQGLYSLYLGSTLPTNKKLHPQLFKSFLLFDWEFFTNELEYE
jgi:hypothetical protein